MADDGNIRLRDHRLVEFLTSGPQPPKEDRWRQVVLLSPKGAKAWPIFKEAVNER